MTTKVQRSHRLHVAETTTWAADMFRRSGLSSEDAATVAWAVVTPSVRGVDSHGLIRIPQYVENLTSGRVNAAAQMKYVVEAGAIAVLDADNGMGHIAATKAMQQATLLAKNHGVAAVGVRNSSHFGAAGTYPILAVEADCIGQIHTNGPVVMPPTGAAEARVSTNPIGTAVPAGEHPPLMLDVAMSIAAGGKMSIAQMEGRPIPEGWALDRDGNSTTDPIAGRHGMLLPVGDHKGYGIALVSDVLSGVLSGSFFGIHVGSQGVASIAMKVDEAPTTRVGIGHFCLAIDIAHFMDVALFKRRMDELIDQIHASKPRAGIERILVPGEIEHETEIDRRQNGIPVAPAILDAIRNAAESVQAPEPSALLVREP